ncbi:MAG: CIA30 family protein [Paracoccaceae bacterium]
MRYAREIGVAKVMMRGLIPFVIAAALLGGDLSPVLADKPLSRDALIEDFTMQPESRWRFFTDQVMGGVSTGSVAFAQEDGQPFARMTGRVSTASRGGFIQMRLDLPSPPPEGTTGVRLVVRGNSQRYFVHLRTGGTLLPWQYYQAGFDVAESWGEVRLAFDAFAASGALLRRVPAPRNLTSVSVVAYGRDHDARIDVREVGFY